MQVDKLRNLIKHTKNLNILYVEDNLEVQTQTAKMLQSFFNNISIANNGKVALELFVNNDSYHILITDIKMPILDGLGFIESIRKINKRVPIIVLSAHDNKDYFLKTINAGIDGYILKPYTLGQITNTLTNIMEKYEFDIINKQIIELDFDFIWNKTENQLFNDEFHEAITTTPAPSDEMKGKIIDCVQKGYLMNDKVIRFPKVVVGQ
jgi:YesN/AraC family two-component response regulator